jgi:hypothetical protein
MNQSKATKTHRDHNRESIATTLNQLSATKTQLKPTTKSTNTHHKPNIIPPPATTNQQKPHHNRSTTATNTNPQPNQPL